ncbi:MAG: glycine--tRNA ligase subunit beta [Alphaproteobacteria bacterium]
MAQLLLELFSEEIPARMQRRAADDLKRLTADALEAARLDFDEMHAYATPRRLVLLVEGLPDAQPDVTEERRGPRADAPEKALQGFLKGNGLTLEQCEKRATDKGEFWFATIHNEGRPCADVLVDLLTDVIDRLPWQKSMRWGTGAFRWVRPLQRVVCVLDGHVVPLEIGDGVPCGNVTEGHRFMSPGAFEVGFFDDYEKTLQLNKVIVKAAVRRHLIEEGAGELAAAEGLTVRRDAALLAEVAGLVEWPVPLMGAIDDDFMALPAEVLTTSMRTHQKYFAVERPDGTLANRFIVVANIESDDNGAAIIAGNELVLRARLSDARFFWDQDRKATLESRVPALSDMVFHHRLGTLEDKVARLQALATEISPFVTGADRDLVRSAATLAKADLTTGMVGEFPELQGVMGRYYALEEGERAEVADAIAEHYAPRGPDDFCPEKPVSLAVSLADKIDTLVGFFAIGETPTGSRDPYALRRAALGVIRMVLERELRLPLAEIFATARGLYGARAGDGVAAEVVAALLDFFADRLKVHLRGRGMGHDLISAVFAVRKADGGIEDDLVRLVARAEALKRFLETEDGANLLAAHKRASNIVAIEEKKDKVTYADDAAEALLTQPEEKALFDRLAEMQPAIRPAIDGERFDEAMGLLAGLRAPVDDFFDQVTVNCDQAELRANRLRLLSRIRGVMGEIADFACIEG